MTATDVSIDFEESIAKIAGSLFGGLFKKKQDDAKDAAEDAESDMDAPDVDELVSLGMSREELLELDLSDSQLIQFGFKHEELLQMRSGKVALDQQSASASPGPGEADPNAPHWHGVSSGVAGEREGEIDPNAQQLPPEFSADPNIPFSSSSASCTPEPNRKFCQSGICISDCKTTCTKGEDCPVWSGPALSHG